MKDLVVDFESYYKKTTKTVKGMNVSDSGVPNYVRDSYAYMLAITGVGFEWVGTIQECQEQFNEDFWADHQFWAANAVFDETWARRYFPTDRMKPWRCILDKGAASQYAHSVAGLVKGLFGHKVDKTVRDQMNGVHFDDLDPETKLKVFDYCREDAREEWDCLQALPEPSDVENRLAAYTRMTNVRGVLINRELVEQDREALLAAQHEAKMSLPWIDESDTVLSPKALKEWCQFMRIPCPASREQGDPECERLMREYPKLGEVVSNMRRYQQYNVLIKKTETILKRLREDDTLPLELIYCGARHTRRWSCRGVNIQNLHAQPMVLPGGYEIRPRHWLVARPGKVFYIPDFSQIEPRCLNWCVGNWELIDLIEEGYGLYEAYARSAGLWSQREAMKQADPALYKKVKAQVLGLGYGMGVARFMEQLPGVSEEEASGMVKDWRSRNSKITGKWKAFDRLIMDTVRAKGDQTLTIQLPTGDTLSHFLVAANRYGGFRSITTRADLSPSSRQNNLWGGVLVENMTQRMARDVMGESILKLEDAGIPCLFSAHDEIIMEVDDTPGTRKDVEEFATKTMTTPPEWAEGLPLAVEGEFHHHYTK